MRLDAALGGIGMKRTEVITVDGLDENKKKIAVMCLASACDVLETDGGSVMLLDKDGRNLTVTAAAGDNKHNAIGQKVVVGERVSGKAAATKKPVLVQGKVDVAKDKAFREMKQFEKINSGLSVPIIKGEKLLGVLNLKRTEKEAALGAAETKKAEIFARELASAL